MHPALRAAEDTVRMKTSATAIEGSDPSPLRPADETDFTEVRLPDRERQLAFLSPAVSKPGLPKGRAFA